MSDIVDNAKRDARTFHNPTPVVVVILPVDDGVLLIRRNKPDDPNRGKLALPGGYLEYGESWRDGAARELFEETGIRIPPRDLEVFGVESTPDGSKVLIFATLDTPIDIVQLPVFIPNEEVSEISIVVEPTELAFSIHTELLARYFDFRDFEAMEFGYADDDDGSGVEDPTSWS